MHDEERLLTFRGSSWVVCAGSEIKTKLFCANRVMV